MKRSTEIVSTFALAVAGVTAALLLLEIFLRLYNPLGIRVWGDRIQLPRGSRQVMSNAWSPKLDPVITVSRNSIGFRGPDPPRDFDERTTIVAVGGSTTECLYLSDGSDWPAVLAERLGHAFPGIWVDNAGLDGHATFGHLALLDQMLAQLRPRVAVFLVGLNDVGRENAKPREEARTEASALERVARHSAVAANLVSLRRKRAAEAFNLGHRELDLRATPRMEVHRPHAQEVLAWHRQRCLPGYRTRIREILRRCRQYGIEPVLMTQPALYGGGKDDVTGVDLGWIQVDAERRIHGGLAWRILEEYNEVVREEGRAANVLVIDAALRMPKSSRFYYDFVHFTREGARELAALAATDLCPFLAARFPEASRSSACGSGSDLAPGSRSPAGTRRGDSTSERSPMAARKRELIEPNAGDKRFVRRDVKGRFDEVVDVGASLASDGRTQSKTTVKPGQGDKGDRKK